MLRHDADEHHVAGCTTGVGAACDCGEPDRIRRRVDCDQDIVTWCVEVIGARDLSRYDQFGSLRDDPNALAVTLAVETLRLLAAGTIPPAADSNERTSDGDAPNRDR